MDIFDRINDIGGIAGKADESGSLFKKLGPQEEQIAVDAANPNTAQPLDLNAPTTTQITPPTPEAAPVEQERGNKFRDFAIRAGAGPGSGGSLLGVLSAAFGQGTQEIANRKRQALADELFEAKQVVELEAMKRPNFGREAIVGGDGLNYWKDTGERVLPNVKGGGARSLAGKDFEAKIAKLSKEDADKAIRIDLGLDARAAIPKFFTSKSGVTYLYDNGTVEEVVVDGRTLDAEAVAADGSIIEEATSGASTRGTKQETRLQDTITKGVEAVQGIPILRRGLSLLERVETGGFDAVKLRAKQLFGVEGADEGELSANLGIAVLSQLRDTFGAAFTENEGKRLERLSAGFGKSVKTNSRLLRQALTLIQGSSDRALDAARQSGDENAIKQILDFQEGVFDLTDDKLAGIFNPSSTPNVNTEGAIIPDDADLQEIADQMGISLEEMKSRNANKGVPK